MTKPSCLPRCRHWPLQTLHGVTNLGHTVHTCTQYPYKLNPHSHGRNQHKPTWAPAPATVVPKVDAMLSLPGTSSSTAQLVTWHRSIRRPIEQGALPPSFLPGACDLISPIIDPLASPFLPACPAQPLLCFLAVCLPGQGGTPMQGVWLAG